MDEGKGEEIKLRLCGDNRDVNQFNAQTSKVPTQKLEDYLDKTAGGKYFLQSDCKEGFWQLALSKRSQEICTLSMHIGNVKPLRLPMGIRILI